MTDKQDSTRINHFESLFNQLHDPVVEFVFRDNQPIIVQANPAFRQMFCEGESPKSLRLNELIVPKEQRRQAQNLDQRTISGKPNQEVVKRITPSGPRIFLYRGVPTRDDRGFAIYTDITDKLRREQYLDVLQRVFRHNLRNDLNVITAYANLAFETAETKETRDSLEKVIKTSNRLTKLCSEAKTIRKILDESVSVEPVVLYPVIFAVKSECQDRFTEAEITINCSDDATVLADDRLHLLIDSLVDNAIRHNTSTTPSVTIEVKANRSDRVEIIVTDNGPGIPETEQQIITNKVGISPLKHGSGLGLWLVKWLTEHYGGSLNIDTSKNDGSLVRACLPQA